jgi:hypothetical protein
MLRGSEGNLDPEMLRRYTEMFAVDGDESLLRSLVHRADKCRRLIESRTGLSEGLDRAFMLIDREAEAEPSRTSP